MLNINKDMEMIIKKPTNNYPIRCNPAKPCIFHKGCKCYSNVYLRMRDNSKKFPPNIDMRTKLGSCLLKYEDEKELLADMIIYNLGVK